MRTRVRSPKVTPARASSSKGAWASPARGDPDVQRRRCALGADAALPEHQRALLEARQGQIGGDPRRTQRVGDAAAQLELAEPAESAREVAAARAQGDLLRAVPGRGARLELERARERRRQQRGERAQLLAPAGQLALDQPALEIDRQVAPRPGARRAQAHVAQPELRATQLDRRREFGRDVPRRRSQAELAVCGLARALDRGGERERIELLAGDQQAGAPRGQLDRGLVHGAAQPRLRGQRPVELEAEERRQRCEVVQIDAQRAVQRLPGQAQLEPAVERGSGPLDPQVGDLDAVVRDHDGVGLQGEDRPEQRAHSVRQTAQLVRAPVQVDADHLGARADPQIRLELGRAVDRLAVPLGEGGQRIDRQRDLRLAAERVRIEHALHRGGEVVGTHREALHHDRAGATDRRAQSALPDHVLGRQLHLGRQPQPLRATLEVDLHPGARFLQALQRA